MDEAVQVVDGRSIAHGIPLEAEQGIGALTLGGWLQEVTGRFGPREAALIDLDGETRSWTYDELREHAYEVARALIACGISKGSRVGVLVTNRLEFLSAVFGTALAGGIAAPLSTFSTKPELEMLLQQSACAVLLVERNVLKKDFAAMLAELEPQLATAQPGAIASLRFPFLRHVAMVDSDDGQGAIEGWATFRARGAGVADERVDAAAASVYPSDPGILLFSSGTTGKPKGILSAHRSVSLQLWRWARWYGIGDDARTWSANGFFWSGNFAMAIGGTMSGGGALILQRWFDPAEALKLVEKHRPTMLLAWPHQWAQLEAVPNYRDFDLSSLKYIDIESPLAQHPSVRTTWREPAQAYGSTETFTLCSVFKCGTPPEIAGKSHGEPTAGTTIKIVDPLSGEAVPLGERGEIAVKGPTLMLGYVGIPLDESLDEDGFLRTGDGGYLDAQGRLFWEGRLNDIIKTGGANVSPLEIDEVLRKIPGVKLAQTVGVPDDLLGEMVVSCIVPHDGEALTSEDVRGFAKEYLASYKVPRKVLFLAEDELATTGSSKVKTAELRKLASERLA